MQVISAVSLSEGMIRRGTTYTNLPQHCSECFPKGKSVQCISAIGIYQTCGPVRSAWESFIHYRCKLNWQGAKIQVAVLPSAFLVGNTLSTVPYTLSPPPPFKIGWVTINLSSHLNSWSSEERQRWECLMKCSTHVQKPMLKINEGRDSLPSGGRLMSDRFLIHPCFLVSRMPSSKPHY